MRLKSISLFALIAAGFLMQGTQGKADDDNTFFARFSGFQELGALNAETGAIFSPGTGTLVLKVDRGNRLINFQLKYSGLTDVTQSHIHFGKRHVPGGVMVFFCSNLTNAPPGTQACPSMAGTVTGTITSANVLAIKGQGFPAGNFDALLAAIESNTAYGNIHTAMFPAGEIRGQVQSDDSDF
jgi:CHRD domain